MTKAMLKPVLNALVLASMTVALAALALSAAGCGDVKEARARKIGEGLRAPDVRVYPRQNIEFKSVQLFLWREGLSQDEAKANVALVLKQSKLLDDVKAEIFVKRRSWTAIREQFAKVEYKTPSDETANVDLVELNKLLEELGLKEQQLAETHEIVKKLTETVEPVQKQLEANQAELEKLSKEEPSEATQKKIEELKAATARLEKQIEKPVKDLKRESRKAEIWAKKIDEMKAEIAPIHGAVVEAGLEPQIEPWRKIDQEIKVKEKQAQDYLTPIDQVVWIYDSPKIKFKFEFARNKSIKASIRDWDLSNIKDDRAAELGAPQEFSTKEDTIGPVTYTPEGGVFEFEVYSPKATFWFRISRSKNDPIDGRIYYKGDIIRCTVEGGYGYPVTTRDARGDVVCGVDAESAPMTSDQPGTPVTRRGVANLVDEDEKS